MLTKKYTLFYSWQSDDPKSRKILDEALKALKRNLAQRRIELTIDSSTLGESGMPSIDQTILHKIDTCDIFLADITPVANYEKLEGNGQKVKKEVPNPNVLLELGYAMSALGVGYVIPVAHRGKWVAGNLPFDVNHRSIYTFTSSDCKLDEPVAAVLSYIKKHGRHRHVEDPYSIYWMKKCWSQIRERYMDYRMSRINDTISEASTVFFSRRIAGAFPGMRDVKEITGWYSIYRGLNRLLAEPIQFKRSVNDAVTDPIWMFERGSAIDIDRFKWLGGRKYLIGGDEVKIKRIIVFNSHARYYGQYVYVETEAMKQTGLYPLLTKVELEQRSQAMGGYWAEEYGLYYMLGIIPIKVTRQEYDDGHATICGKVCKLNHKHLELRSRYVTPFNFIMAAKGSSFNCQDFERTSEEMLNAMLNRSCSTADFHQYMMSFPKPSRFW